MTKEEYAKKLKDPRWKIKRYKIIERDDKQCQRCRSEIDLEVHHIKYTGEPWDAPDSDLITLCECCHTSIENKKKDGENLTRLQILIADRWESEPKQIEYGKRSSLLILPR